MRLNKLNIFPIIFFLFLIFDSTAISNTFRLDNEPKDVNFRKSLNVDYLKQFNYDQYIIGIGDTLDIIVADDYPELKSYVTVVIAALSE